MDKVACPFCSREVVGTILGKEFNVLALTDRQRLNQLCHHCGFKFKVNAKDIRHLLEPIAERQLMYRGW